jgi:hypothetical protein
MDWRDFRQSGNVSLAPPGFSPLAALMSGRQYFAPPVSLQQAPIGPLAVDAGIGDIGKAALDEPPETLADILGLTKRFR